MKNRNKHIFYIFFLSFVLTSCVEKPDPDLPLSGPTYKDINVVTGLDFSDENGSSLGRWRSPNNNPGPVEFYPNPNVGILGVYSQEKISKLYLLPAECLKDTLTENIKVLSMKLDYTLVEIMEQQIKEIDLADFNLSVHLNLKDVTVGFYRVFYQMESGEIYWENLYIDPTVNNIPEFDFLDEACE